MPTPTATPPAKTPRKTKDMLPVYRYDRDIENMSLLAVHYNKPQAAIYRDLAEWKVQELGLRPTK